MENLHRILEKRWIIGSAGQLYVKNKLLFFLEKSRFAVSMRMRKAKVTVAGVTKIPVQFLKSPLPYIKVQRVQGPRFSEKQHSDPNAKLIPTFYSGDKQKKRKRTKNHILYRNWQTIFEDKLPMFPDKSSVKCREVFSRVRCLLRSRRMSFRNCSTKWH